MKKVYSYLITLVALLLISSCNDEWKDEQFEHYISFKAPVNDKGYTQINVRYKEGGKVTYRLPLIISGSTMNGKDVPVYVALDPDTLKVMNQQRFSNRTDLYYKELPSKYYSFPEMTTIKAGEYTGLLDIDFSLSDLDMVEKWILPVTVTNEPSDGYQANMRKNYRKALLRVVPFNDYSGSYSSTTMQTFFYDTETNATDGDAMVGTSRTAFVVNNNTVFFYAGLMDEDLIQRGLYKINVTFNDDNSLTLDAPHKDEIDFEIPEGTTPIYSTAVTKDVTRPYIEHHYVTIRLTYLFNDITSAPSSPVRYKVTGTLVLERKINTQMPVEDQIEWD